MRSKIFVFTLLVSAVLFSACSSKTETLSEKEYQRANQASSKAHEKLDRE